MGPRSSVSKAGAHRLGRGPSHGMLGLDRKAIDFRAYSAIMGSALDLAALSACWLECHWEGVVGTAANAHFTVHHHYATHILPQPLAFTMIRTTRVQDGRS
jgi:hypothetical protein